MVSASQDYQNLAKAMKESDDGLKITSIQSLESNRTSKYSFPFPENYPIAYFYKKINEFKRAKMPFTQLTYSYQKDGSEKTLSVVLPNR